MCASLFSFIVGKIPYLRLPPLLGMLLAGFPLRNVRGIDFARHIDKRWSSTLWSTALAIILIRSGQWIKYFCAEKAQVYACAFGIP